MPELPEVETLVRQLREPISGKIIKSIKIYDKSRLKFSTKGLEGEQIKQIKRVGKEVCFDISNKHTLAIHLRMTGRLILGDSLLPAKTVNQIKHFKPAHLRAQIHFDEGSLDFVDPRRFGTIKLFKHGQGPKILGTEPLSRELSAKKLFAISRKVNQALKSFLLRQDKIVGLGNIYASEILFAANLSPFMSAKDLSLENCRLLVQQTKRILRKAIENCGTTFSDFQQTTGELGNYQNFLKVYNQQGQPCRRCKASIIKEMQAGRSTFYCESCQV